MISFALNKIEQEQRVRPRFTGLEEGRLVLMFLGKKQNPHTNKYFIKNLKEERRL